MKAIFKIPQKHIKIALDNVTYQKFTKSVSMPSGDGVTTVRRVAGSPITMITSNMPDELHNELAKIIESYCTR